MLQAPAFVFPAVIAAVGALLHRPPPHTRSARHRLAVLLIPAITILINIVSGVAQQKTPTTIFLSAVVAALGAVAGWQLVEVPRRRHASGKAPFTYGRA